METSFEAIRRLLTEALESCEGDECRFRIRTALQILEALDRELTTIQSDLHVFEDTIADDPELRAALENLEILEE